MKFRRLVKLAAVTAVLAAVVLSTFIAVRLLSGKTGGAVEIVKAPAELVARGKFWSLQSRAKSNFRK